MPERDRDLLTVLAAHRYLSTHQVTALVFTGLGSSGSAARTARHRLRTLNGHGLIQALTQRVGGSRGGADARIWHLTPAGNKLLTDWPATGHVNAGAATTFKQARRSASGEPSLRFLNHCLAVADVHVVVRRLAEIAPGEATDGMSVATSVRVEIEPATWRRFTGLGGESRWLKPDLAATIANVEFTDHWFIEVDLGTESLPTLLAKCQIYEAYYRSGIEQGESGVFPLVLWVFTHQRRAEQLATAIERANGLTTVLHRYATPTTLEALLREPEQ